MVKNLNNAKFYKIVSNKCPEIYINCTTKKYLSERMTYYKYEYNKFKSDNKVFRNKDLINLFNLFDLHGINNFKILLIEEFTAFSFDELKLRKEYHLNKS